LVASYESYRRPCNTEDTDHAPIEFVEQTAEQALRFGGFGSFHIVSDLPPTGFTPCDIGGFCAEHDCIALQSADRNREKRCFWPPFLICDATPRTQDSQPHPQTGTFTNRNCDTITRLNEYISVISIGESSGKQQHATNTDSSTGNLRTHIGTQWDSAKQSWHRFLFLHLSLRRGAIASFESDLIWWEWAHSCRIGRLILIGKYGRFQSDGAPSL
jgi:hypothetical protein